MAIAFKKVTLAPLQAFTANAPGSVVVGIIGEKGSGKRALLKAAAGVQNPESGSVSAGKTRRYLSAGDDLNLDPADALLLDKTLALHDPLYRGPAATAARPA